MQKTWRFIRRWVPPIFRGILRALWWFVRKTGAFVVWAGREMGAQAKRWLAKKIAPLLWPMAGILGLAGLFFLIGEEGLQALLDALAPLLILVGVIVFWLAVFKPKKKKKKK